MPETHKERSHWAWQVGCTAPFFTVTGIIAAAWIFGASTLRWQHAALPVAFTVGGILALVPRRREIGPLDARRERALELRRGAGPRVAIAEAEGRCHIAGEVHVLSAAKLEPERAAAAVMTRARRRELRREQEPRGGGRGEGRREMVVRNVEREWIVDHFACGRFAVIDGSGAVALVDEDAVEICPLEAVGAPAGERIVHALGHGDRAVIIGPATRQPPPDDVQALGKTSDYRTHESVLVFDGTPDDRVWILFGEGL